MLMQNQLNKLVFTGNLDQPNSTEDNEQAKETNF